MKNYTKKCNGGSTSNSPRNDESVMYTPHYAGKGLIKTYDTLTNLIIQTIQKEYKEGMKLADAMRTLTYPTSVVDRPVRETAKIYMDDSAGEVLTGTDNKPVPVLA